MDPHITQICKVTKRVGNKQIMLFTHIIRQQLLDAGVDRQLLEKTVKTAVKAFRQKQTYDKDCATALQDMSANSSGKEHRGIDSIGRILVEYCFCRTPDTQLIWPEESEEDTQARISFTEGIIPRPLMQYFLVTVRGTVPQLNKFEADSILFGKENAAHEDRKKQVDALVHEFDNLNESGSKIKWKAIYMDSRFQAIALELIGDIRRKIEQFGHERYLRILENLRQRDPDRKGINAMDRPFSLDDAKQLDEALWSAERGLAQNME
ncbi:hypothetical protein OAN24_04355 [Pseudodesulfovibrio sp.]|nr:hypothetical protein [Pseudodesulfovibrio sp.]